NEVGSRITRVLFDTRLKLRYLLTDRTLFEVDGRLLRSYYGNSIYQGYYEFRNEDWADRRIGGKLDVGLGTAFGFVYPDVNSQQTYQQLLARGIYHISGKLDIRSQFGGELREYGGSTSDTADPVVSVAAIYQFRPPTTFTIELHRRDQPSPVGDYNYQTFGFSGGAREKLFDRLVATLSAGYDFVDYVRLGSGATLNRSDSYYSVNVGLAYEVDQHLTATLFYIYQADASNQAQFTYNDNMVGLRVGWRY
ncbi:MAG TPA: outer membrane beta-barrel protein, partial [Verrucomicrobiae bacterium]|nr:outer membrane beta-barrel protein [Verrucomicrobiae bacterium]